MSLAILASTQYNRIAQTLIYPKASVVVRFQSLVIVVLGWWSSISDRPAKCLARDFSDSDSKGDNKCPRTNREIITEETEHIKHRRSEGYRLRKFLVKDDTN
jgi:hypothetical protein